MITLLIALVVIGVVLYLIGTIPMDPVILNIIRVVAILCVIVYVLRAFGLMSGVSFLH